MTNDLTSRNLWRTVFLIAFGIMAASMAWIFRPYPSFDPGRVHPSLSSLAPPFSSIESSYWMDGGSVTFYLKDSVGTVFCGCLPDPDHDRLFIKATYYRDAGAVEVSSPADTINCLLSIVRANPVANRANDYAIVSVSGRVRDMFKIVWRSIRGKY